MPDRLDRQPPGQSLGSVPQHRISETPSEPTTKPRPKPSRPSRIRSVVRDRSSVGQSRGSVPTGEAEPEGGSQAPKEQRRPYGQSFSSVPDELVSEYWYGPTPDGPLLPRGLKRPRRTSPRLRTFDYTGPYAYSLTLNTDGGRPYFTRDSFNRFSIRKLLDLAAAHKFKILAYCFMPNHVHLLVKGMREASGLKPFIQQFKQALGFAFKAEHQRQLWHRSFHDHIARADEDLDRAAAYIWANPVRASIVERIEDYRWSGPREGIESSSGRSESVRNVKPNRSVGGQSLGSVPTRDGIAPHEGGE